MPGEGSPFPSPGAGPGGGEESEPGALPGDRPLRVAVIGGGDAGPDALEAARKAGELLARAGAVVISGGRGGVMEAASRGAVQAGGLTVGILPGGDPEEANPWIRIPLATGFGQGRNVLVVQAGEVVLAVGGGWGTLSEIALGRKLGRDVGVLGPGPMREPVDLDLPCFTAAADAVEWALSRALARRAATERAIGGLGEAPATGPGEPTG